MRKFEYQRVTDIEYEEYKLKSQILIQDISFQLGKAISQLTYRDVIQYFQINYNLSFTFFDVHPLSHLDIDWTTGIPDNSWIKFKQLIKTANFRFMDSEIVHRISGVTIPDNNRTLILINQNRPLTRIIFTILHELSHFYFHIRDSELKEVFISLASDQLDGVYNEELIPFENEANVIASLLYCNHETLEYMIANRFTFKDMANHVGMSDSAMHNRLINYLDHSFSIRPGMSLDYVVKFRNGNNKIFDFIENLKRTKEKRIKKNAETVALVKMQAAYKDKLSGSEFWDDILVNMGFVDNDVALSEEKSIYSPNTNQNFLDDNNSTFH